MVIEFLEFVKTRSVTEIRTVPLRSGKRIAIVGAGLAGLSAASALLAAGNHVTMFDKGRSVGGRLATRRIVVPGGEQIARFDHGAQFFTVRDPRFAEMVSQLERHGLVRVWSRGFGPVQDGHARYVVDGGMAALAKHLASTLLESPSFQLLLDCEVGAVSLSDVETGGLGIGIELLDGQVLAADVAILTPPVPQSLALCDRGAAVVGSAVRTRLEAIAYAPCLAAMVALDGPSGLPSPGAVQLAQDGDPWFSFIGDNRAKGISDVHAVTFHCNDATSTALWNTSPSDALDAIVAAAVPWLGSGHVIGAELKRWRYARPTVTDPDPYLASGPLLFAGDAFAGAKVEGAYLSGLLAASALM
jgi:renalase